MTCHIVSNTLHALLIPLVTVVMMHFIPFRTPPRLTLNPDNQACLVQRHWTAFPSVAAGAQLVESTLHHETFTSCGSYCVVERASIFSSSLG